MAVARSVSALPAVVMLIEKCIGATYSIPLLRKHKTALSMSERLHGLAERAYEHLGDVILNRERLRRVPELAEHDLLAMGRMSQSMLLLFSWRTTESVVSVE